MPEIERVMRGIMFAAVDVRKEELITLLRAHSDGRVMTGPFAGMVLPARKAWSSNDMASKLVGSYEGDLHPWIEAMRSRPYSAILNVGCAEGYYAIGLARLFPNIPVHAFDIDQESQVVCLESAFLNDVGERMIIEGECTPAVLNAILDDTDFPLIVLDCEGYEKTLLNLDTSPRLIGADFIVEVHDFIDRSIGPLLLERFANTHELHVVWDGPRDPNTIPILRVLPSLDRWIAVDEGRPETMSWIVALRK